MSRVRPTDKLLVLLPFLFPVFSPPVNAEGFSPDVSLILDAHYKSNKSALSEQDKGFELGHTELSVSAPVDDLFLGKLTAVLHQHDNKTELEAEEAFIQTLSLPGGFSLRAGRFLSDIGYLNGQHTHADSFVDRPAAYRALLGSHYYDDGVRLSYVVPTDTYWVVGAEAFSGKKMQAQDLKNPESVGVYTGFTKIGGDVGLEHSWQLGFSYLRNENGSVPLAETTVSQAHDHHEHEEEHDHHHEQTHTHSHEHSHTHNHAHSHNHSHDHSHHHCHSAEFTGNNTYIVDAVWKWAPEGNYKYQNLSLSAEYLETHDLNKNLKGDPKHDGFYVSSVFQMTPQWATGVRYGEFKGLESHDDHVHEKKLQETELMLSWSHSHFSTIRLQYTHQNGTGFENIQDNIITLQYVMSLGAHDAHTF